MKDIMKLQNSNEKNAFELNVIAYEWKNVNENTTVDLNFFKRKDGSCI